MNLLPAAFRRRPTEARPTFDELVAERARSIAVDWIRDADNRAEACVRRATELAAANQELRERCAELAAANHAHSAESGGTCFSRMGVLQDAIKVLSDRLVEMQRINEAMDAPLGTDMDAWLLAIGDVRTTFANGATR